VVEEIMVEWIWNNCGWRDYGGIDPKEVRLRRLKWNGPQSITGKEITVKLISKKYGWREHTRLFVQNKKKRQHDYDISLSVTCGKVTDLSKY
jgi:hypothetical protein